MAAWSLADWSFEPGVVFGLVACVLAYVVGARRMRPETLWNEYVISAGEVIAFSAGIITLAVALISPLDTLSAQMFSAHMLQHVLLLYLAPPLLLVGVPAWMLAPIVDRPSLARILRFLTHPASAFLIFNGTLVLWHMTFFWQMALLDPPVHALEHLMFLAAGILAWWPVFAPVPVGRLSYPAQCLYLFVQSLVPAVIGAVITFSTMVVYPVYAETPKLWGLTPLVDQQIAGLLMKLLGTLVLWILVTIRFFQWFNHEEHENEKALDDASNPSSSRL